MSPNSLVSKKNREQRNTIANTNMFIIIYPMTVLAFVKAKALVSALFLDICP